MTKTTIPQIITKLTKLIPIEDRDKQDYWLKWYKGDDEWYQYKVMLCDGSTSLMHRSTLNIIAKVCQDWASLLLNEKTDIVAKTEKVNIKLQKILLNNDFISRVQEAIERDFAIGTGAVVVGKDSHGKATLSFVDGTRCYILATSGKQTTAAAFVSDFPQAGENAQILSIHRDGNVENIILDHNLEILPNKTPDYDILETEKYDRKTFVFIRPAISRRDNWATPFGQSIFANAISANKFVDTVFDSYNNEFSLGRKRIFVSYELLTWKKEGSKDDRKPMFDTRDTVFNMIPKLGGNNDDKSEIKEIDMSLRQSEHENAIQNGLNYLSALCGLGNNYYRFNQGSIQTATQVISENSDLYRNIKKQKNSLRSILQELAAIMLMIEGTEVNMEDISVTFDDSIIVDQEKERENDRQEVRDGVMSKAEYRMKWYGENGEEAKTKLAQIEPIDLGV